MAPVKTFFLAAVLVFTSFALIPVQTAYAQGTKIITFDQARLMRESTGGKDIGLKLQAIGNSMKTELEAEGRALDTEGKSLEARTANLTREALAADTSLRTQLEAFGRKRSAFQQKGQIRQAELQQTEQVAWNEFFTALQPIIIETAKEQSALTVIERSTIAYSDPSLDVTDTLISKMNAIKPSFTVTRARVQLPEGAPETIQ